MGLSCHNYSGSTGENYIQKRSQNSTQKLKKNPKTIKSQENLKNITKKPKKFPILLKRGIASDEFIIKFILLRSSYFQFTHPQLLQPNFFAVKTQKVVSQILKLLQIGICSFFLSFFLSFFFSFFFLFSFLPGGQWVWIHYSNMKRCHLHLTIPSFKQSLSIWHHFYLNQKVNNYLLNRYFNYFKVKMKTQILFTYVRPRLYVAVSYVHSHAHSNNLFPKNWAFFSKNTVLFTKSCDSRPIL